MIALLLLLLILLISAAVGREILRLLGLSPTARGERYVYAIPLGLGCIAYLVLLLGLCGLLSPFPVSGGLALLTLISWRGLRDTLYDTWQIAPHPNPLPIGEREHGRLSPRFRYALPIATALVLGIIALIALINCFVPPAAHEWDALSYHLAAPKVYIERHRIVYLPTDHHSNFPFTMQMLFAVGLLFEGYALANLFHFATAALCVAAILVFGKRYFAPTAGQVGALALATTPIVLWEAGAAYIEMGFTMYVLISVGAILEFRETREIRWLTLGGILMGFALSVKALALVPFFLVILLLLFDRVGIKTIRGYLVGALVVGCPFYIKSWVWTGNPVYPFAYSVFGGRDWNRAMADQYAGEQRGFGLNHQTIDVRGDLNLTARSYEAPKPLERVRNQLLLPFDLVAFPRIFHNLNDVSPLSHLGFLFLSLPLLLLVVGGASPSARWCAGLTLLWFISWSQTMQYTRYVIAMVPFLALMGGEGAHRIAARFPAFRWLIGLAIALQAGLLLASFLPEVPDQFARATDPAVREAFLTRYVNVYAAEQWINHHTPPDAGVVLFEETRGFYLDRPYLWGNSPHSLYIPYDRFADGRQMVDWFLGHGIRYALVNLQYAPFSQSSKGYQRMRQAFATGDIISLLLEWYDGKGAGGERWRHLLGDAIAHGSASFVPEATAPQAVVLRFQLIGGVS